MCGRCHGRLFVAPDDPALYCVACGWRFYPPARRLRLSDHDRAQRRVRVRRVAQVAASLGVCLVCGARAVTSKHCQRHREMNNPAALARKQARRAAGLCRRCPWPAETRDFCRRHREMDAARQRDRWRFRPWDSFTETVS